MEALLLAPALILAYFLYRAEKRIEKIEDEQRVERQEWAEERRELNTRIQVPERAKTIAMPPPTDDDLSVAWDDDDSWRTYQQDVAAGKING